MPSLCLHARLLHSTRSCLVLREGYTQYTSHQRRSAPRCTSLQWPPPFSLRKLSGNLAPRPKQESSSPDTVSSALQNTSADDNNLLAPVHITEDPNGVLNEKHPAASILANSAIVVQRQLELMNLLVGFEQANKYVIMDPQGNHIGYIAERDLGIGNTMARQMFRTHRSFQTHVFDKNEKEFHRPFAWISSCIGVYDPLEVTSRSRPSSMALASAEPRSEANNMSLQVSQVPLSRMRVIGEAQQQWAPLRRKYNLFLYRRPPTPNSNLSTHKILPNNYSPLNPQKLQLSPASKEDESSQFSQFAYVDEPFLSWDFSLLSADSRLIGSVNRNFAGFGREIFTDTGVYALRMDAAGPAEDPRNSSPKTGDRTTTADTTSFTEMTLDQRAVMLATAVTVDFDYFSRKSGSGTMMWFPWLGGGTDAAGVAGAEAAGGVTEETAGAAAGAAGAATMATLDSMHRGTGNGNGSTTAGSNAPQQNQSNSGEEIWGDDDDPWSGEQGSSSNGSGGGSEGGSGTGSGAGGGGEGGGGGGGGFDITDLF